MSASPHLPPPPSRKRPAPPIDGPPPHTPRTRRRILGECMPVTPMSGSTRPAYVPSPRADGLDALAAVACTTSASLLHSSPRPSIPLSPSAPSVTRNQSHTLNSPPASPRLPVSTPGSTISYATRWLSRLVAARPELAVDDNECNYDNVADECAEDSNETSNGDRDNEPTETADKEKSMACARLNIPTTPSLRVVVPNDSDWIAIVTDARHACRQICNVSGPFADVSKHACDARALYYAALDGLLRDEAVRLQGKGERGDAAKCKLSSKLIRNKVFHQSVMAFAWECAVAASGRYDMRMLWMAMDALDLSPFALTKVVEAFVKRFKDMPQHLKLHMMTCDARIVESKLWKAGSELLEVLAQRQSQRQQHSQTDSVKNGKQSEINNFSDKRKNEEKEKERPVKNGGLRAKDVVLQMVYKKVLGLASLRAQELLLLLGLDGLAEAVWACFKSCIWQQWHLMVDRHLDQLVMCCVYGVAKARRIEVKFKEIVTMYRTMKHVREVSFTPLLPGVIRQVSLVSHCAVMTGKGDYEDEQESGGPEKERGKPEVGDVIKFYNDVFIPSMKHIILQFKFEATQCKAEQTDVNGEHKTGVDGSANEGKFETGGEGRAGCTLSEKDALRETVLKSPMRSLRNHGALKRIGRVTVGPMSPGDSAMVALRQSPARRSLKMMTPGTRTLYAFESPGMMTRSTESDRERKDAGLKDVQRQLSFDVVDMKEAVAARKRFSGVLAGKGSRVRFANTNGSNANGSTGSTSEKR